MRSVLIVVALVGVATVVAAFAHRIRVPAPSLLVIVGVGVGLLPGVPPIQVSPDIVGLVVLPPLLYAAGEDLSWRELKRVWRPVTVLAIGLVAVSAAAVGAVAVATVGLPVSVAFLLGAVLASTDPVAVTALGRRLALPARLQTLVQAESLFNDATSLILVRVAAGFVVASGALSPGRIAWEFVLLGVGGAAVGAVIAAGVAVVRAKTEDPIPETVTSLLTPYLAFVAAEAVHASGVTAVVVASVILGVLAPRLSSAQTRLQQAAVHATVVFVLESVVFALIGLALPDLIRGLSTANQQWLLPALAIAATLMLVRVAWVFPLSAFQHWRHVGADRPIWHVPAVISWAGARGVVPLAAALSIPLAVPRSPPGPRARPRHRGHRDLAGRTGVHARPTGPPREPGRLRRPTPPRSTPTPDSRWPRLGWTTSRNWPIWRPPHPRCWSNSGRTCGPGWTWPRTRGSTRPASSRRTGNCAATSSPRRARNSPACTPMARSARRPGAAFNANSISRTPASATNGRRDEALLGAVSYRAGCRRDMVSQPPLVARRECEMDVRLVTEDGVRKHRVDDLAELLARDNASSGWTSPSATRGRAGAVGGVRLPSDGGSGLRRTQPGAQDARRTPTTCSWSCTPPSGASAATCTTSSWTRSSVGTTW